MEDLATVSPTIDATPVATSAQPSPTNVPSTTASALPDSSQPPTGDPQEQETLFKGDRSKMTPEQKLAEDNMLRDYKKKTAQIAEERKKFEQERTSLAEKAQRYEALQKDERFLNYLRTLEQESNKSQTQAPQNEDVFEISDEEYQQALGSKEAFSALLRKTHEQLNKSVYEKVGQVESTIVRKEAEQFIEAFTSQKDEKGNLLRPYYESFHEDGLIDGYLRLNPAQSNNQEEWAAKLTEAYDFSNKIREKYFKMGQESVTAVLQKKQASSTQIPSATVGDSSFAGDARKLSDREAFELAKKGIRVPQN